MPSLNLVSFIFLVVLFVLTPRAALRSARMLRQSQADGKVLPRLRMALSTMFALTVLWFLSAINASAMGKNLFSLNGAGLREAGIGLVAFALLLASIPIMRRFRRPDEERRMLVFSLAPRSGREWAVYAIIAVMAGIAEESAYRGVAVWTLTPIFGSIIPAVFLSAMAFGVAHAVQGGKTMVLVFVIALLFHAIVLLTHTLVIAMVVHAAYDLVAGHIAAQRARELGIGEAAVSALSQGDIRQ